jgi:hypothetical protein
MQNPAQFPFCSGNPLPHNAQRLLLRLAAGTDLLLQRREGLTLLCFKLAQPHFKSREGLTLRFKPAQPHFKSREGLTLLCFKPAQPRFKSREGLTLRFKPAQPHFKSREGLTLLCFEPAQPRFDGLALLGQFLAMHLLLLLLQGRQPLHKVGDNSGIGSIVGSLPDENGRQQLSESFLHSDNDWP